MPFNKKTRKSTNPEGGRESILNTIDNIVEYFLENHTVEVISIASAGRINKDKGEVFYSSDNLPGWKGMKLKEYLTEKYNKKIIVDNDCNVTGLGEEWKGAAKDAKSYVLLALGTGVGAAVKVNGHLLYGSHWSGGELGHMTLFPNGRECNCGLRGCLEQYCSGPSLVKSYNKISPSTSIKTGYEFFELVSKKDIFALQVLDEFAKNLSTAIVSLSNIYDPEVFIIGGGLIDTKDYWWDLMIKYIRESGINNILDPIVVPALLGSDAAYYGAAYMGLSLIE